MFLGLLWFSPLPASFAAGGPDRIRAVAVGFALLALLMLLVWLLALGLGRLVRRLAGERPARLALVFVLVFVCATLLGAALPRFEDGMRVGQGGSGWTMANGIEIVCWGVPREPCERRAAFLLRASEAIHPDLAPTMVEIGRPEGDRVCDGIPMVAMTCWRID